MTAPTDPAKLDHAIELYQSGKSLREASAEAGVSYSPLRRAMVKRGVKPLSFGGRNRRDDVSVDDVAAVYLAGESELAISQKFGISRSAVRRRLKAAGVSLRSMSEASTLRMQRLTAEERRGLASAAHDAVRGVPISEEHAHNLALSRQGRGEPESFGEQQMSDWLADLGERAIPQFAIGPYNVDLAIAPVAVEILGGSWHRSKTTHAKRTPYILDQGWHLMFIWVDGRRWPFLPEAAEYVVAFLDEVRRDPPTVSQYRVIRGDAQEVARGGADDDQRTLVQALRSTARS